MRATSIHDIGCLERWSNELPLGFHNSEERDNACEVDISSTWHCSGPAHYVHSSFANYPHTFAVAAS
jgi:hypothetical protein